ncbi:hypothetical protein FOG51_02659 [Hanseniaspora uvarum]|nr:hypothetical protein FOG48_03099 [Hanseniaspora uvarum]KAF0272505.1 hypothetical protein FOG51_02659 [Hanseniaspora uvarum]KAF0277921.1 hypothetical protein FOG50_01289 [Hanseniaspora uvarum]
MSHSSKNNHSGASLSSSNILPSISKFILSDDAENNVLIQNYNLLVEKELELDSIINKKTIDLVNNSVDIINEKITEGSKSTLRIFISNTAENQPWQQGEDIDINVKPSWKLRIEGKILGNDDFLFSDIIKHISVSFIDFDPSSLKPDEDDLSSQISWNHLDNNSVKFNGLDIKRFGVQNRKIKIVIELKNVKASEFIDQIVEINKKNGNYKSYGNTQDLINLFVEHILSHDLVDHATGLINLEKDANLFAIANKNIDQDSRPITEISLQDFLQRTIKDCIQPLKPLEFDYEIRVDKETTFGENCFDIKIQNPVEQPQSQQQKLADLKKAEYSQYLLQLEAIDKEINELNAKNTKILSDLNTRIIPKYNFYNELSSQKNPAEFLSRYIEQQAKINKEIISQDNGYMEDLVRRSDYYIDNEDNLKEQISLLLQNREL